ncbi:MAG: DUF3467 domain-containing protein [Planctomycetota bacterium]|jgi:hypothetical protein
MADKQVDSTTADSQVEQQAQEQTGGRKVRLRVDQRDLRTSYANGFRTQFTAEEVIIDFGMNLVDQSAQTDENEVNCIFRVNDRVIMNYYSAKRLAISLGQQIRRYEDQFGPLELSVAKRHKAP